MPKRKAASPRFSDAAGPLPEIQSTNYNVRSFGERVALNTPIQAPPQTSSSLPWSQFIAACGVKICVPA